MEDWEGNSAFSELNYHKTVGKCSLHPSDINQTQLPLHLVCFPHLWSCCRPQPLVTCPRNDPLTPMTLGEAVSYSMGACKVGFQSPPRA